MATQVATPRPQPTRAPADISFRGGMGFYSISPVTEAGARWMRKVQGFDSKCAYTDDTKLAVDIADGAVRDGLAVVVNDTPYEAFR
jgi:hypothetical protein